MANVSVGDHSPDAPWIRTERWENLNLFEREQFLPIYPNFVIEFCSLTETIIINP
jgi:Uma2 family endonuclease